MTWDSLGYLDHKCKLEDETYFYTHTHSHTHKLTNAHTNIHTHTMAHMQIDMSLLTISNVSKFSMSHINARFSKIIEQRGYSIYKIYIFSCIYINQIRNSFLFCCKL